MSERHSETERDSRREKEEGREREREFEKQSLTGNEMSLSVIILNHLICN